MNWRRSAMVALLAVGAVLAGCASETSNGPDDQSASEDDLTAYRASPITDEDIADPSAADTSEEAGQPEAQAMSAMAAQTADSAIAWYRARTGNTSYEGYCEKAAADAWHRRTRHPSAIDHWRSSDGARHSGKAPKGAFVFWNTSQYGHVAVADGNGGAWSTSVNHRIGHITNVSYFRNYLGWKPGNSN